MITTDRNPVIGSKVRFTLMGFDQDATLRLYSFRSIAQGIRTDFTVGVDLALIVRFGIHIQDLPLLCRGLLEQQVEGFEERTFTFSENEMRVSADKAAIAREAALQRKHSRSRDTGAAA